MSKSTIYNRCKFIYAKKGIVEHRAPRKVKNRSHFIRSQVSEEEIYQLKQKGLTYKEISEYYEKKGVKISSNYISSICMDIYTKNGEKPPKAMKFRKIPISDEEIFELREKGLFYKEIQDYYSRKGIKISIPTLQKRCEKIYAEKGMELPQTRRFRNSIHFEMEQAVKELNKELDELLTKKSASEQLVQDYENLYRKEEKGSEYKENEK